MIRRVIGSFSRQIPKHNEVGYKAKRIDFKFLSSTASTSNEQLSESKLQSILLEKFPQASVKVEDISGGCGAMFEVHITAKEFKNLSIVKQHQMVNAALKNEVKQMHGIRIFTESS